MESPDTTSLQQALAAVAAGGKVDLLRGLSPCGVDDAIAIAEAFRALTPRPKNAGYRTSNVFQLSVLVRDTQDEATRTALRVHALPVMGNLFDGHGGDANDASDRLFVLRIMAVYGGPDLARRIADGVRRFPDEYGWSTVFDPLADHPEILPDVVDALKAPFPCGLAALAYLDACNSFCFSGLLREHPFDSPEGHARIREWLAGVDEDTAQMAVCALAFFGPGEREALLAEAESHPATKVRMEAAWARARGGDEAALQRLVAWCEEPQTCWRAEKYLAELGAEDRIPTIAQTPEFRARLAMAEWLEGPTELDRAPDEVTVVDTRELFWPPTNDRRRVFAIRYVADRTDGEDPDNRGQGMVGSDTCALLGEETWDLSPPELYGLHCAQELHENRDPRAPAEVSVTAGLAVLRQSNPDLG